MNSPQQRKPMRLKGYDYSENGFYFITICTKGRECLFGDVVDGTMLLNECGDIAEKEVLNIPTHYIDIEIHYFVVMPNHVHIIIALVGKKSVQAGAASGAPTATQFTLGNIVRGYKSGVSRRIGHSIWQRNFYDHIIRDEDTYLRISTYIENNPKTWEEDRFYQQ